MKVKLKIFLLLAICLYVSGCDEGILSEQVFFTESESTVTGLPEDLQALFWGDPEALTDAEREYYAEYRAYYTKYIDAGGVAIIGHDEVDDAHFYYAREVILIMTSKRPELRERLTPGYKHGVCCATAAPKYPSRFRMVLWQADTPRIPEHPSVGPVNAGTCGVSCNALVSGFTGRLWSDYSVVVHEFAHAIHYAINDFDGSFALNDFPVHDEVDKLDPMFQARLEAAYAVAKANAVDDWEDSLRSNQYYTKDYAMTNVNEYWAVGVAYWFEYMSQVWPEGYGEGRLHYHDSFLAKDPLLYALLDEWFPLLSIEVTIHYQ